MQEVLIPMAIPALAAHLTDVRFMYSDNKYYEMCGQMKTLLDRSNPIFPQKYAFRDIYLLAASADVDPASMDGAVKGLQGWIDCFSLTNLAGVVRGVGATQPGDIRNSPSILQDAYQMGKNV